MIFDNVKKFSIPEGEVKKIEANDNVLWELIEFTNQVPISINTDGTIYNGTGYKEGYRLSSSGAEKAQDKAVVFGFIPCTEKDTIRMAGLSWKPTTAYGYSYIAFYDKNFNLLSTANKYFNTVSEGVDNLGRPSSATDVLINDKTKQKVTVDENGVTTFNLAYIEGRTFAYIRISAEGLGENAIVTINEEITY